MQAVQAGVWRTVKRLSSLWGHACAARAVAVKRVPESPGTKTPGVAGELGDTPATNAEAGARIGRWPGSRPAPVKRRALPTKNAQQRPRSIPTLDDRARQAVYLQALPPIADATADQEALGVRPKRRCADARDPWCKRLQPQPSATWILAGDMPGFFENLEVAGLETHRPRPKQRVSTWRRHGFVDRRARLPTTAGVPPGGIISPVISTRVVAGLAAVVQGGSWHRRVDNRTEVRGAADCRGTATSRQVFEATLLPRIHAFLAARGVRLSPPQTVITPSSQGVDGFGQTWRKDERPQGKPAQLQTPPSQASLQAINAKGKVLGKHSAGSTPAPLIGTRNPVLRGWPAGRRAILPPG